MNDLHVQATNNSTDDSK